MKIDDDALNELVEAVMQGSSYRQLSPELVRRIARQEMAKRETKKEVIRAARSKLHQTAGAYLEKKVPYKELIGQLDILPDDLGSPEMQAFCHEAIAYHASTRERLPILQQFYMTCMESIRPITSILDLGCGFNPLCLPWMPVSSSVEYTACDIYADMVTFINKYFQHCRIKGEAALYDLGSSIPSQPVQLALALKMIPCLEQSDKSFGRNILRTINAEHILVSFPVQSLGGRSKGMQQHYTQHFYELIADGNWRVQSFTFDTELAFLITR